MSILRRIIGDAALLIADNKYLIVFTLLVIFVFLPWAEASRLSRVEADYRALSGDSLLRIIEAEKLPVSNVENFWIENHPVAFAGKFISLYSIYPKHLKSVFFKYSFSIDRPGMYKIFMAGSPPGPLESAGKDDFNPFEVTVDKDKRPAFYREQRKVRLDKKKKRFYADYVYAAGMVFVKLGEFELAEGQHQIRIDVLKGAGGGPNCNFLLDAIFVMPVDWKSKTPFLTLPDDLFSY
jgi:hypothetical protein